MNVTHLPETEWITDGSKPVHVGIYKRKVFIQGPETYNKWDGKRWLEGTYINEETEAEHQLAFRLAASVRRDAAYFQNCMGWKGLAKAPDAFNVLGAVA